MMPTVEDVLDDLTLQASEIVSREDDSQIVIDLYNVISQKCENGDLLNELNRKSFLSLSDFCFDDG